MATTIKQQFPGFATGQVWKADNSYLQIVDQGKRHIHYKLMKAPGQPAVITRLIKTEAFAVYLCATGAILMN
jgi:hypothetical protein